MDIRMRFVCTQQNLLKGLSSVAPLAGKNKQLPILSYILCEAKQGVLHVTATDLELGVHSIVPGKVEEDGTCAVNARKLFEYVGQIPATNPLYLSVEKDQLKVTTEGFTANFPTTSAEDFPLIPTPGEKSPVSLPAAALCQALNHTVFAAAKDETRPEIHSVFVKGEGSTLSLAATDSFRLAEQRLDIPALSEPFSFLLPLPTTQEIIRLFRDEEDQITLSIHPNYITIQGSISELSSRLIEGTYPAYQSIIPTSHTFSGSIEQPVFVRALRTLAVFLPRDSKRIRIVGKKEQSYLELSVGGESGEGSVQLPFEGEPQAVDIVFNIQYLLEGVQHIEEDRCLLHLGGADQPGVLKPQDSNRSSVYVIMPIQQ